MTVNLSQRPATLQSKEATTVATTKRGRYDRRLLAHKVNWEGGILAALQYGIRSDQIGDPALAKRWAAIEELYRDLMPRVSELERDLRTAA